MLRIVKDSEKPKKKRRVTRVPKETEEQQALVRWLRKHGIGYFAVPNGAHLNGRNRWGLMQKLKNEGLLVGCPDLILIHLAPANGRPVAIEMKRVKGSVVSIDQLRVAEGMRKQDWNVITAYGAEDGIVQLIGLGFG